MAQVGGAGAREMDDVRGERFHQKLPARSGMNEAYESLALAATRF
jgi:hypothetical protein